MSSQTALALPSGSEKNIYESLALRGDISALSPQDKAAYLKGLCESLGLNPLTQPFIPLKLNGKEILYASRGATDQLASVHKLTREITKTERIEDIYIVTCKVTAPDGRFDISTGAVTIGGLKGDALANALMKAETKSKRRAVLSFCGLSFLDETELETIPREKFSAASKGQLIESAKPNPEFTGDELKWRDEIEQLLKAVNINPEKALEKYRSLDYAGRANAIREVRKTAIKTVIGSDIWGYSEDGTIEFLAKFGVEAIDSASDEQLRNLVEEMRDLGLL